MWFDEFLVNRRFRKENILIEKFRRVLIWIVLYVIWQRVCYNEWQGKGHTRFTYAGGGSKEVKFLESIFG